MKVEEQTIYVEPVIRGKEYLRGRMIMQDDNRSIDKQRDNRSNTRQKGDRSNTNKQRDNRSNTRQRDNRSNNSKQRKPNSQQIMNNYLKEKMKQQEEEELINLDKEQKRSVRNRYLLDQKEKIKEGQKSKQL